MFYPVANARCYAGGVRPSRQTKTSDLYERPEMTAFTRLCSSQFLRYLAVGGLNTLFGYGCFAFFLTIGLHYALASLLATLLGVMFNFKSFGMLAFQSHDNRRIVRFAFVYVIVYLLNVTGLKLLSALGMAPYLAGAALLLPMAALTYLLHKRYVFHHD